MQLTSTYKLLVIAATTLTLLAACGPNRRGAGYGFDYFQTEKKCEKELLFREKDEEYLKHWTAFRALLAQQAAQKPTAKVIITGDSIAALFTPPRMEQYLPGVDVANTGIGGDTTVMLQQRVQDDIVARRPRAVLISIGGNDLLQGRCIPETLENTRKIWQSIRQGVPGVQIYQSSMPPTLMWKANAIAPYYNWLLKYATEDYSYVTYVDFWREIASHEFPEIREGYKQPLPGGGIDFIHFGEEGYRSWGEMVMPEIGQYR